MDKQNVACTIEHYLVLKRKEILTYAIKINLEDITQNEIISPPQKDLQCMSLLLGCHN